jgi:hypothetical protein
MFAVVVPPIWHHEFCRQCLLQCASSVAGIRTHSRVLIYCQIVHEAGNAVAVSARLVMYGSDSVCNT